MKTIKLQCKVDESFLTGIARLQALLGFEQGEDITVTAEQGNKLGVRKTGNQAVIYYTQKHHFFRELGVLVEQLKKGETDFSVIEDGHFETVATMIDTSRCAVPTVQAFERLADRLVLMGYNMIMVYIEDLIKLENRPYFGYMRGRYTPEELKKIDDYCFDYGIEVVPCLECYGHMEKYLFWWEANEIKDTSSVLLARSDATFQFLDELISTASSCVRSKKIHIGMDEAWDMGRGKFLTQHGYVSPFEIFGEYMESLIKIVNKYELQPYMWSDMYFRFCDTSGYQLYYGKDFVIPKEVADKIPENMELVFWHYGEAPKCDDYMLKKHKELNRKVMYAGGFWDWVGHFPEHDYAMESCRFSLQACRNNGIKDAMGTVWRNDNAECDLFASLFDLSFFAENCYDIDPDKEKLRARFETTIGADYDLFYAMQLYHNSKNEGDEYPNFSNRFLGKPLFWQDIMEGLYDTHLFKKPMSGHYEKCAKAFENYRQDDWSYLYDFAYKVFDYLAVKTKIAENLVPAYKENNREQLAQIARVLLPKLKEKTVKVHEAHKRNWFQSYKAFGWSNMDIRYAGVVARCETAQKLLEDYLSGKTEQIESLEEERLYKGLNGFVHYSSISSPNLKT
ncbi:MAG: family 20 glycosylhydrolase [Clostridia bacterium]|nr:family 20 glycosylhydrolase [Clostridia bacterium]